MEENCRFTKQEIAEQKMQLAFYILNELTEFDVTSIQISLKDIKEITGLDISLEQAIQMKRLATLTSQNNQTKGVTRSK